ncbi:MAG: TIGR00730 family Rossman fold protein [Myxococcota bacterium]
MESICVYCGASPGRRKDYVSGARAFGRALAARGVRMVYGGGSVGVMGAVADTMLLEGGEVIGIIPEDLVEREIAHQGLTELRVVSSMHERKREMVDLSDGFVALPGGLGTLEELFEVLTWAQLGLHEKPCGILDVGGFYEKLAAFLAHAVEEEFVEQRYADLLVIEKDPEKLLRRFETWEPPRVTKVLRREST